MEDISKVVVFNAPLEKVWKAVSTAEGIASWFMPNDLQAEMGYEFTFDAGQFGMSPCKITELDPPHLIGFDWGKDWHLQFQLKDLDGKTEFHLIHSGWGEDKVTETGAPHTVIRGVMDQGWGELEKLRAVVEA
ncbi:SRPBCC domain-containing protein [Tumebacillus sp. ITR2]|uniref:SRPBCC domain-containing protein n=1 Tax=Tumebacillus amylolyticus TaxID=2801339 RepID=A0ABS1J8V9_9BACL|nr:SRPBCC domain-containing protein [Tumebacillus amylolyticus]MBL0386083.1 SRPBCC domain-containing protein [Tumebacillus amylolyticus]